MQRKLIVLALVAGASLFAADAARAQYLDSFLDAQRWSNLREHQQEQQKKAQQQHNRAPNAKPVTLAERQDAAKEAADRLSASEREIGDASFATVRRAPTAGSTRSCARGADPSGGAAHRSRAIS